MSEANGGPPGRKPLSVYAVIERRDGVRPYWMKLGAAFTNRDGSLTLILDAFPWSTNRLLVREARTPEARTPDEEPVEAEAAP
ncbi:MAG TPA: hypothetical protein VMK42_01160 [Anaeromyxobacteraceae bacterium]|nr:hypothetical protein [Anaeromyxobacteraceae bacterium]